MNELLSLARRALLHHYGLAGELTRLPGEVDFNFQLTSSDGQSLMLRLYAADSERSSDRVRSEAAY